MTPLLFLLVAAAPIDPAYPRGWPAALDAIDAHFYSWSAAERIQFTLARTSDVNTWLTVDELKKYIKKRPALPTPPERVPAEIVRLSNQVTFDVEVVAEPFQLRVTDVHLGELEGAFDAEEVEAVRKRVQTAIYGIVFGTPNYMMVRQSGFFTRTTVVTKVERDPGGPLLTVSDESGSSQVLLDDESGLPVDVRVNGVREGYTFGPGPSGTTLLTTFTYVAADGKLLLTITYTYGDVAGVTVPTSALAGDSTLTFTNWRFEDTVAPFLAKRTAPAVAP